MTITITQAANGYIIDADGHLSVATDKGHALERVAVALGVNVTDERRPGLGPKLDMLSVVAGVELCKMALTDDEEDDDEDGDGDIDIEPIVPVVPPNAVSEYVKEQMAKSFLDGWKKETELNGVLTGAGK